MIAVSSKFTAALAGESIRLRWLVDIGSLKWTSHTRDIAIGTETWAANGLLMRIPAIKREREFKAHSITLQFSAIDASVRTYFLNTNHVGERVALHICLLDSGGTVIGPEKLTQYEGLFDDTSLSNDVLTVKVQSPFAKPSQTAGRLITNASQQEVYPGDRFFSFAHRQFNNLQWGKETD